MVNGSHVIFYAKDAEKVPSFFKEVLELSSVDAGHGWLIFALPPAEFAVHPTEGAPRYELYLMCDDIQATTKALQAKGVEFPQPVKEERWGLLRAIKLPGGGEMGLYEPRHPTALKLNR
jgi:predicted enzyme related to lactoylglutathione lyase